MPEPGPPLSDPVPGIFAKPGTFICKVCGSVVSSRPLPWEWFEKHRRCVHGRSTGD